ncbi:hypothetical protein O3G_MSEX013214 [Manduca sexta]|uniref:Uncharacterized protein n=1 Tax=Manduca sexta TaxID=7130 RepID=A0A921ZRZ5_MANSE|nr:hypothetical protein O3G_MSEX013214 [Manduca sexta]
MASVCIHDNRVVCGSTPDGCSRRRFLDQCDMYEYNCDYGTNFGLDLCDPGEDRTTDIVVISTTEKPIQEDDYLSVEELKLSGKDIKDMKSKVLTPEHQFHPNCDRPHAWITTKKGETRDFYRVLQDNMLLKR